jgi:hypothetical protein
MVYTCCEHVLKGAVGSCGRVLTAPEGLCHLHSKVPRSLGDFNESNIINSCWTPQSYLWYQRLHEARSAPSAMTVGVRLT